ncbi:MAG: PGPGW domain-containing protein [Acidimicrobiales bacterium]
MTVRAGPPNGSSTTRFLRFMVRSSKRVAVLVLGGALVVAGLAMLVLPGPGFLVIIGGLAVLATEFAWAAYLLDNARRQYKRAERATRQKLARRSKTRVQ